MILTGTELVCPAGTPSASPIIIDLAGLLASEARQQEVATVTAFKAAELLWVFNRSWIELNGLLARLHLEKNIAEKQLERRRAILLLDVIPERLKERKIPSNDANREAFTVLDGEFSSLEDTVMQIAAVVKFIEGKAKGFENSYNSVKKLISTDGAGSRYHGNSNLKGDTESSDNAPEAPAQNTAKNGWGKPPRF